MILFVRPYTHKEKCMFGKIFDSLEGYRSLILTYLTTAAMYLEQVRATLSEVTSLFGMPLDSSAAVGAFIAAALVTVKVAVDRFRKKDEE